MSITHLDKVRAFHDKFGIVSGVPVAEDLMRMRFNFMLEELVETASAYGFILAQSEKSGEVSFEYAQDARFEPDRALGLDGFIDLEYVLLGSVDLFGFARVFDEGFDRVHNANMKKVRVASDLIGSTRKHAMDVIKPEGWKPAKLDDLV